jgi:hypothetical protein
MEKLRHLLFGKGEFKSRDEIIELIEKSDHFDPNLEGTERAKALLIFQTSIQQTWLIATNQRLYCVLDDLEKGFTNVQWAIDRDRLVANNKVKVHISTRDYPQESDIGLVKIEVRDEWWLYSKKLFTSESIEKQIKNLIADCMVD